MTKSLAYFISLVLHPLFLFLYIFVFTLLFVPGSAITNTVGLIVFLSLLFLNTVLFPVIGTYFLTGGILLEERKKRTGAFLITIFFYSLAYFFLLRTPVFEYLKVYMLSIIAGMIVLAALNLRWKISMHSSAMGSVIALFVYKSYEMPGNFFYPLIIVVLLAGLAGSARLRLNAHSHIEIYLGYITGFTITALIMGSMLS